MDFRLLSIRHLGCVLPKCGRSDCMEVRIGLLTCCDSGWNDTWTLLAARCRCNTNWLCLYVYSIIEVRPALSVRNAQSFLLGSVSS